MQPTLADSQAVTGQEEAGLLPADSGPVVSFRRLDSTAFQRYPYHPASAGRQMLLVRRIPVYAAIRALAKFAMTGPNAASLFCRSTAATIAQVMRSSTRSTLRCYTDEPEGRRRRAASHLLSALPSTCTGWGYLLMSLVRYEESTWRRVRQARRRGRCSRSRGWPVDDHPSIHQFLVHRPGDRVHGHARRRNGNTTQEGKSHAHRDCCRSAKHRRGRSNGAFGR